MRITCLKESLRQGLCLLKAPSDKEGTLSMHAQQDQLRLECNYPGDWLWIRCVVPAEVEEPGSGSVALERLESILTHAPEDMLHLSFHEWHQRLNIEGERHRHSLNGSVEIAPSEWLLEEGDTPWYTFDAPEFGRGLKRVLFAMSQAEEDRAFLRGVLLHRHQGQHRWIATDGRRLAMSSLPAPAKVIDDETAFPTRAIPYPACAKLVDVVESLETLTCRLRFREEGPGETGWKFMIFECGDVSLRCRLAERDYPDWRKILPDPKPPLEVKVDREALLWALELAQVSVNEEFPAIKFQVKPGKMTLEGMGSEVGRSQVQIPIHYDGPATQVAFNAYFIREGLIQTSEPSVVFRLRSREKQLESALLELSSDLDYLVMPMRL